jgi:fumarate reductase subunit C
MSDDSKTYIRPQDKLWWLRKPDKLLYMLRELSSGFFLLYGFILVIALASLAAGEGAYNAMMKILSSSGFIILSLITLFFACVHAFTWYVLAPKAMAIEIAGRKLPDAVVVLGCYGMFFIITLFSLYWVL